MQSRILCQFITKGTRIMSMKKDTVNIPPAAVGLLESTSWVLFGHAAQIAKYARAQRSQKVKKRLRAIAKKMNRLVGEFDDLAAGSPTPLLNDR
jgi:hypothetical protein